MADKDASFDFIIVGGGPAGCILASRIATSVPQSTVLLIEAGGKNADPKHQSYRERHWTFVTASGYDWGYTTTPQANLQGREINYSRGKGLGGSTSINFCVFTRGPKADYDEWALNAGDDAWSWKHALERFKRLETFGSSAKEYQEFVHVASSTRGFNGPLNIGLPHVWDEEFGDYLRAVGKTYPVNRDHNSGDPLGMAVCQVSATEGHRVTASGALLANPPSNLTIMTGSTVERIILDREDLKATGVEIAGKIVYAKKEVILTAGAIDSPKLLLLSGIGPKTELAKHGVDTFLDLPGVGKNLQDHLWIELVTVQKPNSPHRTSYINSPASLEEARAQYAKDNSGDLAGYYLPQMIAYLKNNRLIHSEEFQNLDDATKKFFLAETRPHYELISHIPSFSVQAPEKYHATAVAFMSRQVSGEVTLRSADPKEPPLIDPKFLAHPFDRRVAIESVREALEYLDTPSVAEHRERISSGPLDRSDEEILKYIQTTGISMWHMSGTAKMGKPGDPDTCVDGDGRVAGVKGLRVADMSIAPWMICAHTQAVAYLIGDTIADKIIAEYTAH